MNPFDTKDLETLAMELPDEILKYKMCGDLAQEAEAIERWLARPIGEALKKRLNIEKIFIRHYPVQFPYTKEQAIAAFADRAPGFDEAELERVDKAGLAEWMMIDGEKHYIHNIVRNVFRTDDKTRALEEESAEDREERVLLKQVVSEIRENGVSVWKYRLRTSIKLKDELFRPGMYLKAHLPIPAVRHQISDVKILSYAEGMANIDPEDSLFRTICFEDTLEENREFFVEYEYTVTAKYHDYSEADEKACAETFEEDTDAYVLYTGEQYPHIRFNPYLVSLAKEIVGDESDPLKKAQLIFDYITKNVKYSYMKEYFLIEDIPQYCARNLRGDCGVQALLFITLCRICGVPAKWQSGLYTVPKTVGMHDWAMFYVKPYGWLFADPSFGGSAYHDQDEARRQFYFGNLDPFRMVANNAFQQTFANPKVFQPIDPYDNQTGEMETLDRGFAYAELEFKMEMEAYEKLR